MSEVSDVITPSQPEAKANQPLQILDGEFIANVILEWEVTKQHYPLKSEQQLAHEIVDGKTQGWGLDAPVEDFLIFRDELPEGLRQTVDRFSGRIKDAIPRSISRHMHRSEGAGDLVAVSQRFKRIREKELLFPNMKDDFEKLRNDLEKQVLRQLRTDINSSIADGNSSVAKVIASYQQQGLLPSNFVFDYNRLGPRTSSTPDTLEVFKSIHPQNSEKLKKIYIYDEDGMRLMELLSKKIEDIQNNYLLNAYETKQMLEYVNLTIYFDLLGDIENLIARSEIGSLDIGSQKFKSLAGEFYKYVEFAINGKILNMDRLVEVEDRLADHLVGKLDKPSGLSGMFVKDDGRKNKIKNELRRERLWKMTTDEIDQALSDYQDVLSKKEYEWLCKQTHMRKNALSAKVVE